MKYIHARGCVLLVGFVLVAASLFISSPIYATDVVDTDNDGIANSIDNCPNIANANQADADADTVGDACDNAPNNANPDQADADGDHVGDVADNCALVSNSNQMDDDHDGIGNACDNYNCVYTGPEVGGDSIDNDCDGTVDNPSETTPPVVGTITVTPSGIRDSILYITGLSTLSAPVSDAGGSGINPASCRYSTNNGMGSFTTVPSAYDSVNGQCVFQGLDTTSATGIAISVEDNAGNWFNTTDSWLTGFVVDATSPTGYVNDPSTLGEVKGSVGVAVTTEDAGSYIKNVCLKYGVSAPDTEIACKPLADKDWNSWPYAPSFAFNWNTTVVADGAYKLYAVMTDNAGNAATTSPVSVVINNGSIGSSASNPALITTCQEFQNISAHPGWFYRLENDIDCGGISNFTAISDFGGELNGQGYTIKNLKMVSSEDHNRGIFNSISTGAKITGVNFTLVDIACSSTYCGGVANTNYGTIEKSSIQGVMTCNGKCGGFASQNSGIISRSYADLTMSGELGYAGLIAGQNYSGHIENCYAKGIMNATTGGNIGGLVGLNERWINYGDIMHSYAAVDLNGPGSYGGVIGWQYQGGSQLGTYWDTEVSGYTNMCGSTAWNDPASCTDENGLSTASMKIASNYTGWDFEDIWAINSTINEGYPYLRGVPVFVEDSTKPTISLLGNATVTVTQGEVYEDAGATAQDDVDGNITAKIHTENGVNTAVVGTYTVTYTVADAAGNSATPVIRTVIVAEKETSSGHHTSSKAKRVAKTVPEPTVLPLGQVLGAHTFHFNQYLHLGVQGNEVRELQKRLRAEGLFNYPTDTGYFGPITRAAVIEYQKLHGIVPAIGFVGPLTRAELNK